MRPERREGRAKQEHGRSRYCSRGNALTRELISAVSLNGAGGFVCKLLQYHTDSVPVEQRDGPALNSSAPALRLCALPVRSGTRRTRSRTGKRQPDRSPTGGDRPGDRRRHRTAGCQPPCPHPGVHGASPGSWLSPQRRGTPRLAGTPTQQVQRGAPPALLPLRGTRLHEGSSYGLTF